jgi:hypothetical protein
MGVEDAEFNVSFGVLSSSGMGDMLKLLVPANI